MPNVLIRSDTMTDIADAIREKGGTTDTMYPADMPQAILDLPSSGGATVEEEENEYGGITVTITGGDS